MTLSSAIGALTLLGVFFALIAAGLAGARYVLGTRSIALSFLARMLGTSSIMLLSLTGVVVRFAV